jgi:hypothetical protein
MFRTGLFHYNDVRILVILCRQLSRNRDNAMGNTSRLQLQSFSLSWGRLVLLAIIILMLIWTLSLHINGSHLAGGGQHNISMAYNLYNTGTIALSAGTPASDNQPPEIEPTNWREPLPPVITALYLWAIDFEKDRPVEDLYSGELAAQIKRINLFWALLAIVGIWLVTRQLTGSFWLALAAILTSTAFFIVHQVNDMGTELPAAALLTTASLFGILSITKDRPIFFVLAALTMGALCLTKAAFLYISAAAIVLLAGYQLLSGNWTLRKVLQTSLLMTAGIALVIVPWMVRNYHEFGRFEITQRGGNVLFTRAYKSQMNITEFRGAFYYWAPGALHEEIGTLLGYSLEDLQADGDLIRLNRRLRDNRFELTLPFAQAVYAEWHTLFQYYTEQGVEDPAFLAEQDMQRRAMDMIFSDPTAYLRATIPFVWRGMWSFGGVAWTEPNTVPMPGEGFDFGSLPWRISITLLNGLSYLSLLALPLMALRWRRADLLSFALLPLGMMAFYALLSHNLPRYNSPAIPAMLMAFLVVLHRAGDTIAARLPQVRRVPRFAWGVLLLFILYPIIVPIFRPVYVQLTPLPIKWLAQIVPVDLDPVLFYERVSYQYQIERELHNYDGVIFSPLTGDAQRIDVFVLSGSATVQERLDTQQRAAIDQWRQSQQPEHLQAVGIAYLLISREWAETLSDEDYQFLQNEDHYRLLHRWESSPLKTWHELYRVNTSP